ncbi:MAG: HAD-IA family hydrolase [Patescibacteria group bacterium]
MTLDAYLQKVHKTHLIFDFDETLVKLILPWDHWEDSIKDELLALDKTIYENYKKDKISLSDLMNQYILKFGTQAKDLVKRNAVDFETTSLQDVVPHNELIDFIKRAKQYTMFVWSSNTRPTVKKVLQKYRIWNTFKKVVTSLDVDLLKPNTEGFSQINKPTIPTNRYVVIGDSDRDKEAAKQLGIDFFLIDYFKPV